MQNKLVLLLLGSAAMLVAADPSVGTWKVDLAKSKYKTGALPKEQLVTVSEEGSNLHVMVKGTSSDGKPFSWGYSAPATGGAGKVMEGPWDTVSVKQIGDAQREAKYAKGGKVMFTVRTKVSPDGKMMTATVKGNTPLGQIDGTTVAEKQ